MSRARQMPLAGVMRSLIALTLVVLSAATAVVPHRHGFSGLPSQSATTPDTLSTFDPLDRGARGHEYPCGACARQQGLGFAPSVQQAVAPRAHALLFATNPTIAERTGSDPNVWLRGPPSVVC